jgi:hypothetical protein
MDGMPIPFKVPLFKIERLVTISGSSPRHRCVRKLSRLPTFSFEAALTRKIISGNTSDVDIQID